MQSFGAFLRSHFDARTKPYYQRQRLSPSSYLAKQRIILVQDLPPDHSLYERIEIGSGLLLDSRPPKSPRIAFTEDELKEIKKRRTLTGSDPDDANLLLQKSQLLQMWNANCDKEEQWMEYDAAQPIMEQRKVYCGLPDDLFQHTDIVDAKKRRVVSGEDSTNNETTLLNSAPAPDGDDDLEEGEIRDTAIENAELSIQNLFAEEFITFHSARMRNNSISDLASTQWLSPPQSPEDSSEGTDIDVEVEELEVTMMERSDSDSD